MPTADEPGQTAEDRPGDFRFGADGRVEVFDGVTWRPYQALPDADPGPIIRDEPPPAAR